LRETQNHVYTRPLITIHFVSQIFIKTLTFLTLSSFETKL